MERGGAFFSLDMYSTKERETLFYIFLEPFPRKYPLLILFSHRMDRDTILRTAVDSAPKKPPLDRLDHGLIRLSEVEQVVRKLLATTLRQNSNQHTMALTVSDLAEQIQLLDTKLGLVDAKLSDLFRFTGFADKRVHNRFLQIGNKPTMLEDAAPASLLTEDVKNPRHRSPEEMDTDSSDSEEDQHLFGATTKEVAQVKTSLQRLTVAMGLRLNMVEGILNLRSDKHFLHDYSDCLDVEGYYFPDELNRRTNKGQPAPEHWSGDNPSNLARMAFNSEHVQRLRQSVPNSSERFVRDEEMFPAFSIPAPQSVAIALTTSPASAITLVAPTGGDFEEGMDLDWHFPVPGEFLCGVF